MINEKIFEDILWKYPELIENGLIRKGRQVVLYRRRIDLLFTDEHSRDLLIELKVGPIKDEHIGQIMSYEGMLLSADNPSIRIMLLGNRVPPNIQRSLDHHGIAWKELSLKAVREFLKEKSDAEFLRFFDQAEEKRREPLFPASLASHSPRAVRQPRAISIEGETKEPRWKRSTNQDWLKAICSQIEGMGSGISCEETDKGVSCSSMNGSPPKFLAIRCGSALTFRYYSRKEVARIYPPGVTKDLSGNRKIEIYKKIYPGDDLTEAMDLIKKCYQLSQML